MDGKKRVEKSGDIVARLVRSPEDARRNYGWTVFFEVVDGGLLESAEEFMFSAPESGYQPSIEVKQSKDDPKWRSGVKKSTLKK